MAIQFDEVNDYYLLADSSAMDFGASSEWCVGIWTRVNDNSGSAFQYLWSSGGFSAVNSANLWLDETTGIWECRIESTALNGSTSVGGDGKNRLIIVQSDGTTMTIHMCEAGQASTQNGSKAFSSEVLNGAFYIGSRADGNVDRYYGGIAGEFFKGDFHLTADEITALGAGATIWQLGYTPDAYLEMKTAESTIVDLAGVHDGSKNSAPTTVEDFPINRFRNFSLSIVPSTAAITSALTGTINSSVIESDIVTGGKTTIITLTGDTFVAAGTGAIGSTADTQALIDGFTSAQSETNGWNAEVRDKESTGSVVRTSSTVATITWSSASAYDVTAQETITGTIPAAVLTTSTSAIVSSPTFTVDIVAGSTLLQAATYQGFNRLNGAMRS